MHSLVPYLRRHGHGPLPGTMLRRIELALNEAEALRAENAELKAKLETATDRSSAKGRKESAA